MLVKQIVEAIGSRIKPIGNATNLLEQQRIAAIVNIDSLKKTSGFY